MEYFQSAESMGFVYDLALEDFCRIFGNKILYTALNWGLQVLRLGCWLESCSVEFI